jgi:hypothetical protein
MRKTLQKKIMLRLCFRTRRSLCFPLPRPYSSSENPIEPSNNLKIPSKVPPPTLPPIHQHHQSLSPLPTSTTATASLSASESAINLREREMSSGSAQGSHSLAFRVMTLCKPSFHVDPPLRLDPADLIVGEDIFDDPIATYHLPSLINSHVTKLKDSSDLSYRTRFLLHDSSLLYVLYACDVDWSEINWILVCLLC